MAVVEKTKEEVEFKLKSLSNDLTKIAYLESIVENTGFSFEIKRFVWTKLVESYKERGMFEKAAKALANKAGINITFKEKINDYLGAAEIYAKIGKIEEAEEMFVRATREANSDQKNVILLTRKNIYLSFAKDSENKGKTVFAGKFYEKLLKMKLEDIEKQEIKKKLIEIYRSLGKFKEAELLKSV